MTRRDKLQNQKNTAERSARTGRTARDSGYPGDSRPAGDPDRKRRPAENPGREEGASGNPDRGPQSGRRPDREDGYPEEPVSQSPYGNPQGSRTSGRGRRVRNREYAVITWFFLLLFLALMAYFTYFQEKERDSFISSPYNSLQNLFAEHVYRGEILSSDGYVLAKTETDDSGNEVRTYPYSNVFAHAVGYYANGKSGLESAANFNLLRSHQFFLEQIVEDIEGEKVIGDNVVSTLSYELQMAAYNGLGDYKGAVIALDPTTGEVLCMVSKPDFNPNTVEENWDIINAEGSTVLYNRASQGQYAPGSTFKILTLLEYYKENPNTYQNYTYTCDGDIAWGSSVIHCAGYEAHGQEDLKSSFAHSCNTSFANIGLSLDEKSFAKLADSMLFNQSLPVDFASSKSSFTLQAGDAEELAMQTAIGQGNTLVSPLHMAMIAGAICNQGILMEPYLVKQIENNNGILVTKTKAREYGALMSESEAAFLEEYMQAVVDEGTGSGLSGQSYEAFGKTGTAQTSQSLDQTNAWFVGYAREDGKEIAIAVVVENSGTGSSYAVPIAKSVFEAYFGD